jgi:hypothetical protein
MKKFLLIAGVIMAIMTVVQPTYAATKHFNIVVTISEFNMDLFKVENDGTIHMYNEWPITVPPSGILTMTAMDAVMISLTGNVPEDMNIFTHVQTTDGWIPVLPGPALQDNEFILEVTGMDTPPTDPLAQSDFHPITEDTWDPAITLPNTGGGDATVWLIYKFHAGPNYDNPNATLDVKIEAMPQIP